MHRISWLLGLGAALIIACGVESAPADLPQSPEASSPSSVSTSPGDDPALAVDPGNLDEPTSGIFCPVLPPDCCAVRISSGCRVCVQIGC